jgi:hypothetical protein
MVEVVIVEVDMEMGGVRVRGVVPGVVMGVAVVVEVATAVVAESTWL